MNPVGEHTTDERDESTADAAPTRRRFLEVSTVAGLAAAGLGTSAAATTAPGSTDGVDVIEVASTGWLDRLEAHGSLPVVDEVFAFVHGLQDDETAAEQTGSVLDSLAAGGYEPDAGVALEWPTTINFVDDPSSDFRDGEVGEVLADLVAEFAVAGGGSLRLVGHSLGARCVFETLTSLSSGDEIATVATLGATAFGSAVCEGAWNEGLGRACEVRNYYSGNDSTVLTGYGGDGETGLGATGATCDPAESYVDVDVTDSVAGHHAYLGDETVGSDLAAAIADGDCEGTGGSGRTSGSSGGGLWGTGGSTGGSSGGSSGGLWGTGGSSGGSDDGGSADGGSADGFGWF